MSVVKSWMINNYYRIKYRKTHLHIAKGAQVSGGNSHFEGYNKIGENSSFCGEMGYGSYIGRNCHINATIGRYCCISDRVYTIAGTHPSKDFVSIHPAFYSTKQQCGCTYVQANCFQETLTNPVDRRTSVHIGNDVWVGCDVTLLGGIQIGDGAIIAAGAVVNRNVEPYTIVGGVPAKPIRQRFTQEQISFLQEFQWWDKDPTWLIDNVSSFKSIVEFMKRYQE